jgi:hypothetical protein
MSEQLTRLRAEIEEELAVRSAAWNALNAEIETLKGVLSRIDRIEAEMPAAEEPSDDGRLRAPRRDLQGKIMLSLDTDVRGLTLAGVREQVEREIGETTESAIRRALDALIKHGKAVVVDGRYYDAGHPHAREMRERVFGSPPASAAE